MGKRGPQKKNVSRPGDVQTGPIGEMAHDAIPVDQIEEIGKVARIEAQESVNAFVQEDRQDYIAPPVVELAGELLFQETPRYFICAAITYFRDGYHTITVSGVRQLAVEDLDQIESKVLELFADQIEVAGNREWAGRWAGLPDNHIITIQNINRL